MRKSGRAQAATSVFTGLAGGSARAIAAGSRTAASDTAVGRQKRFMPHCVTFRAGKQLHLWVRDADTENARKIGAKIAL
jgi:hypothetical protein